jgi:anti-sigma factor RsiW
VNTPARPHPDAGTLAAYWLGELDPAQTEAVDLHLLGCEACGAQVDGLAALADGVRRAFDAGLVGAVVGAGFVQRLAERGLRVREYRVAPQGSVACTVAPDDDVVLGRLAAPLAGLMRVDLLRRSAPDGAAERAPDIPFDAASGEVIVVSAAAQLRALPDSVEHVELVAVQADGERVIGTYTFNHHAWR